MELLEGHTLARELTRGSLAIWRALSVARDVARALGHGHARGVVHRDVKPSNVFLCASGVPKLLDLGLASVRGEAPLTAAGTALGTPAYMAPEQSIGMPVGPTADVYALGGVLFEMLTGRRAFEGSAVEVVRKHVREPPPSPSSFRPEVPPPVDALVLRMLAKQPADRPADGDAAAEALDAELR
jgi:serine/threonine protein kinase